ncbi:hypothetical protein BOX15_Mlig028323g2 [Macrostomum lignano]|uniref:Ras-GAP domain-containing protein n=1 Tax=Macrostomum lignano TaxID=282301 RepID=A0A267H3E2_9PLAT|nr:hypothetical protein BOX15_Mlig028323g2 [Macrostomum lignano]
MDTPKASAATQAMATANANATAQLANELSSAGVRLSAEEMDERRRSQLAYQYLCRLEEARVWLEACIRESLPPAGEQLEACLQNGVALAKLANAFAPRLVPIKSIFDPRQDRFLARGLDFRHTDNINHFLKALQHIGLPRNYWPETTDIYDGRNMPKLVYCLHALGAFLFRSGRAARIEDLYGKVTFTEAELSAVTKSINADQMSKFRSIGDDILGEENKENMPSDSNVSQVDFKAIEEAVQRGQADRLLHLLVTQCPALPVRAEGAQHYLSALLAFKRQRQHHGKPPQSPRSPASPAAPKSLDMAALTSCVVKGNRSWERERETIQSIDAINASLLNPSADDVDTDAAVEADNLTASLLSRRSAGLPTLLWSEDPRGRRVYRSELRSARLEKGADLTREELELLVFIVNKVGAVNDALGRYCRHGDGGSERLLAALREPELNFDSVSAEAISQYAQQLIAESTGFSNADDGCHDNGRWLTHREIAHCLVQVNRARRQQQQQRQQQLKRANADAEQREARQLRAIRELNSRLRAAIEFESDGNEISVDEASRLAGLLASGLQVESLESELSELCLALLRDRACVQLDRDLWLQDLQDCRREAGRLLGEARDLVDCLWRLEAALADCADQDADTSIIDTSGVVSVLADPRLRLGVPVLKALAGTYLDRLMSLRGFKADELGFAGRLDGSHLLQPSVLVVRWPTRPFYVLLPQRRLVWSDRPPALPPAPLLTREEAEEAVRRENEEFRKSRIRETSLPFIITLQAAMRGFLVRRRLRERRQLYSNSLDQIVAIQRWWRRCQRDRQLERRLARYNCYLSIIVQMQARARMVIARRAYKEQLILYRSLERRVIRIQAWWRGCRVRQQYQRLCDPSRPVTLSSLRPFLQAAEHSWSDYHQEIELVRVRAEIVEEIRQCQKVERQLSEMDTKIGLLVRNRLTLQEVVRHSNRLLGDRSGGGGASGTAAASAESSGSGSGSQLTRQQVEKEAKKIELYQQLVHLLQTQPVYLTSSLQQTPESLPLLQLFNYLEGDREQYLYMRLFCSALPQELARLYRPAEVLSPTPGLGKLLSGMSKAGQACLSTLLRPLVGACLRDSSLCVNSSPAEVYALWLAEKETESGVPAGLPYQVTAEQALEQPEVRSRLDANVRALRQTAGQFVRALTQCRLPYSVRLAAKCIREYLVPMLANSNSTCPEKDAIKLTCQMVITRFISPMLASPESHDVIDDASLLPLTPEQRRTLGSVAKMLQLAAANKGFGAESCSHLHCLNRSLREWHQSLKDLLLTECRETADPGAEFDMDEYSEMARLTVPTLHISVDDLQTLHLDLLDLRPSLTDPADPLAEILDELERVADGARPLLSAASSSSSSQSGRVTLHLSPRHDPLDLDYLSEQTGPATLALRTKRLLVDILLSCHADQPLDELIRSTSTPAEERRHELLLKSRERLERQVRTGTGWRSRSNLKEGGLPLDAKKSRVLEALDRLAGGDAAWSVDRLLRELADDIRQWHGKRARRRQELARLYATRQRLAWKRRFQEEQADYYARYCQACVRGQHTLARSAGSSSSAASRVGSGGSQQQQQKQVKYTAAELHKRGIVQEIDGLSPGQYRNLQFEVTEIGDGVFEVVARFMGVLMDRVELTLQELLRLQHEGAATIHVFNRARVNVNLLLHLINKKFYTK